MVVMLWSLTCNCCEPSFDALMDAKRNNGLEVVTIATDRADDPVAAQRIRKKLSRHGLAGNSWTFGTATAERLRYDINWRFLSLVNLILTI